MTTERQITRDELLDRARAAYDSMAWSTAVELLIAADRDAPLDLDTLELLGVSAHLVGRDDVALQTGMRAFAVGAASGEIERAARAGWWTGMAFAFRGEIAQAGAWFGRAAELIEKSGRDSVESGYLLVPVGIGQLEGQHDPDAAFQTFEQIAVIAERFGDVDLATIGRLGRGEALIALGERERGIRFLDEAMAGVTAGEVSPPVAGMIYCATIEDCHAIFDIRRAQEWTTALSDWCAAHPELVFRGRCLIYRAELMRFHGDWTTAADEVQRAQLVLAGPPISPAIGEAHYEEAELHRVRGNFEEAERAYTEGSAFGRRPEPGLALLRLAQGRAATAHSMIARALEELPDDPRLLEAAVTIALGRGDAPEARSFVERLQPSADSGVPTLLQAIAARAEGEVLLAEGKPREALRVLRTAFGLWQQLDAPHDMARVRVGIARACRALGDNETAELETAAARRIFDALGAAPALADLDGAPTGDSHGLSPRELEVLHHLAGGRTNREIADQLGISERTVDRHVSNLYTKLDVSTRAAATAWAYEHDLA
jgi:DNA-binding NarL/FixJ family response regulator